MLSEQLLDAGKTLANVGSQKKQESPRKTSTSTSLTMLKGFDSGDHNKLENS